MGKYDAEPCGRVCFRTINDHLNTRSIWQMMHSLAVKHKQGEVLTPRSHPHLSHHLQAVHRALTGRPGDIIHDSIGVRPRRGLCMAIRLLPAVHDSYRHVADFVVATCSIGLLQWDWLSA